MCTFIGKKEQQRKCVQMMMIKFRLCGEHGPYIKFCICGKIKSSKKNLLRLNFHWLFACVNIIPDKINYKFYNQ